MDEVCWESTAFQIIEICVGHALQIIEICWKAEGLAIYLSWVHCYILISSRLGNWDLLLGFYFYFYLFLFLFIFIFIEMLLDVSGCIDFTISLSKSLMWHVHIGRCKLKILHLVLIEFNLIFLYLSWIHF